MPFQLNEVIPWGRSFEEYRRMFALSDADLAGRILGCGDGPASFNAEATTRSHAVVSCDPIYAFSAAAIEQRVSACYDGVIAQARTNREEFVWDYFRDPDHLGQVRLAAMRRFLADFPAGKAAGRYVTAALPDLPFADGQFYLALVSHLLFLYSEQLDLAFHRAAVEELLRVAREVRIFPLLTLGREPSPHVEPIRSHVRSRGWWAEIALVPYEFQRGGNHMLRIIGRKPTAPRPHDDRRHRERQEIAAADQWFAVPGLGDVGLLGSQSRHHEAGGAGAWALDWFSVADLSQV